MKKEVRIKYIAVIVVIRYYLFWPYIKRRDSWWRHHNKSRNLCVDYEIEIFAKKWLNTMRVNKY